MLDFAAVRRGDVTITALGENLTRDDLRTLTDELIDTIRAIVADATDADVVFEPVDPAADDRFGIDAERDLAWTLAHVVVHATASSEEAAALASSLARGVVFEGRSRYETPWRDVRSVAQLQARLDESQRMRHAFLNTWPDQPDLTLTITPIPRLGPLNAVTRYLLGMLHEDGHLEQMREIMRQARTAHAV